MEVEVTAVVLDNGSGQCKAGFAGDDAPRAVFNSCVGRPKVPGIMVGLDQKDIFMGNDATEKRDVLRIDRPIDRGFVTNWDDMEKIWHHSLFSELQVCPDEHPIMMTESPLNPRLNREKTTQIMFEVFSVPQLYLALDGVLSLFSSGRTCGVVMDSGQGITNTVPIYEGYAIPHAMQRIEIAGQDMTVRLSKILQEHGHNLTDMDLVNDIKEKKCCVADDFQDTMRDNDIEDTVYHFPDGKAISIGKERFEAPEVLFQPSLGGYEFSGVHQHLIDSVNLCDQFVRNDMLRNICLSGGSSMFPGIDRRMELEVSNLTQTEVRVYAPPERKFSVWNGGSILASMSNFHTMWITKAEYEEVGSNIVHRKCF